MTRFLMLAQATLLVVACCLICSELDSISSRLVVAFLGADMASKFAYIGLFAVSDTAAKRALAAMHVQDKAIAMMCEKEVAHV